MFMEIRKSDFFFDWPKLTYKLLVKSHQRILKIKLISTHFESLIVINELLYLYPLNPERKDKGKL